MVGIFFSRGAAAELTSKVMSTPAAQGFVRGASSELHTLMQRGSNAGIWEMFGYTSRQAAEGYVDNKFKSPAAKYMERRAANALYGLYPPQNK